MTARYRASSIPGGLFASAFLLLGGARCVGQSWDVFNMASNGYPSNTVRAIAHDSAGGTWVGTDWGLCHFDGLTWEVLQVGSGLPENDVRALACDGQGRVWIGMFTQGLVIKDGMTWTQYLPGTSPMPGEQVRNITFDHQGFAWLSTTNGLARTDLTDWRIYNDTDTSFNNLELPGVNIADVAVREDGLVCIGTLNAGFTYLTDTMVRFYNTFNDFLPDNTALGVAIDSQGDRWAACPAGALLRFTAGYNDGLFFQYSTVLSNIPTNALTDIVIDANDRKFIATQNAGLTILDALNGNWTTYNEQNSDLPDDELNCVSLAPDGSIWIGTMTGGAARFSPMSGVATPSRNALVLKAWPNPFNDRVRIEGNKLDGAYVWRLSDGLGRTVQRGEGRGSGGPLHHNISGLAPGTYIFTLATGDLRGTIMLLCQ